MACLGISSPFIEKRRRENVLYRKMTLSRNLEKEYMYAFISE